jgi:CheY-like chemotaxis protein
MKHPLQVLLVDDEEIVHQTIAGYMRDLGHHVDGVYDGANALESIKAHDYDLGYRANYCNGTL